MNFSLAGDQAKPHVLRRGRVAPHNRHQQQDRESLLAPALALSTQPLKPLTTLPLRRTSSCLSREGPHAAARRRVSPLPASSPLRALTSAGR